MARDARWLASIDLAFVDRRFGADAVDRVLAEPSRYGEPPPRLDDAGRLTAVLAHDRGRVTVELRVDPDGGLALRCTCARGRALVCEHAVRVLVDVAAHDGMRAALAAGEPTAPEVAKLAGVARELSAERRLDERLAAWLPPAQPRPDLELDVEAVRFTGAPSPEARPAVLLRFRRAGARRPLPAREVLALPLGDRERRLVDLTLPAQLQRDALVATRAAASMLVELLREEIHTKTANFRRHLRFGREPLAPRIDREPDRLVVRWCTPDGRAICDAADALFFQGPRSFLWSEAHEAFHPVDPNVDPERAWAFHRVPSIPLPERSAERAGRLLLGRGRARGVALPPPEAFGLPPAAPARFELRLSGTPLDVTAELVATTPADDASEARASERVLAAGIEDGAARGERAAALWETGLAALRASQDPAIDVVVEARLARAAVGPPATVRVDVTAESGWLDVDLTFTAGALRIELESIRAALADKTRWVELTDGTLARISDDVAALAGAIDAPSLRLPAFHAPRVSRWVDKYGGAMDEPSRRVAARLAAMEVSEEPRLPARFGTTLRPYQRQGCAWLQMLRELGAGGVLADDMGLGKTVMTLAFLARWREEEGPSPVLVVCPTSVAGNWRAEAARFAPELASDLVVMTYGQLRREIDDLVTTRFRCAVLDEAQNVKNPESATARAARRISADMRVALSGTPVENRLSELWSIMTFANPGLLGDRATFDDRFERPIAMRPDGAVARELAAIVRPFILRRTKAAVLTELPPRTLVDRACPLGHGQRALYDALALTVKRAVKKDVEKRGRSRSRMSVLTAILRLRQMACDPRLVDRSARAEDSAKRAAFLDIVRELVAEERRALVFSQFVELLGLWREDLDREKIRYEYLDGGTVDRDAIVRRFSEGDAPLFLVSLKAGGAGLNLTAADTVILCDPWWNPAVEDQAEGRAHRIGQTRPVTVVRLWAEGTIEDKVRLLGESKRALASAVIGDGGGALRGISDADLEMLLGAASSDAEQEEEDERDDALAVVPDFLGAEAVDELRAAVRWLDRTGVPKDELAKKVGVPASRLSLLLIGHRVRMRRAAADRIHAIAAERGRPR